MSKYLNVSGENAELILHGIIGQEISGVEIANKLQSLKEIGIKKVTERLNSNGGSIVDGYSIVSANLNLTESGIIVETINEGVADSMMSIVLASGTKGHRKARDFTTSVVHNPLFNGTSLNDMKDEGLKAMLTAFKESLLSIYAAAVGKTKEEISETMNEETMLNPEKMLEFGIIDKIIETNINLPNIKNKSLAEITNIYKVLDKSITNKKENKMSKMNEFYALSKDASEDSLLDAAKAERQKLTDVTEKVKELENDLRKKTEEYDAQVLELEKFENETIKVAVKAAIDSGKFEEKDKASLIENAKKIGVESFNDFIGKMKIPHVDVAAMITGNMKKDKDGKPTEKIFEDYSESELVILKATDPKKFDAIIEDFNKREVE